MFAGPMCWLTDVSSRCPWRVLLIASLAVGASIFGLSRLHVDTTLAGMLGGDNAAAAALARINDEFHAAEDLLVVASAAPGTGEAAARGQLLSFAERLADAAGREAGRSIGVTGVRYRADPEFENYIREVVVPAGVLWLDDGQYAELLRRLEPAAVRDRLAQNAAMLAAPGPGASQLAKRLLEDPLRLHELLFERFAVDWAGEQEAELSLDRRALLIRVSGERSTNDIEFAKRLVSGVADLAAAANLDSLDIRLGGGYAVAATSATAIRRDAISSTIGSGLMVTVFLAVAYRRALAPAVILAAAAAGVVVAFGLYSAVVGVITPLTAVLAAMLAGLGVDYAVHFRSRYESSREQGQPARAACTETAREISGPMVTACVTSICGFAVIALSEVRMLQSFAVLGSIGLIGALVAVFTVHPALLVVTTPANRKGRPGAAGLSVSARMVGVIARRARTCLACGCALLAVALLGIVVTPGFAPPFDSSTDAMHPQPNAALETGRMVRERFSNGGETLFVHIEADSAEELVTRSHAVARRLSTEEAAAAGVLGALGLANLVPDPATAQRRLAQLAELDVAAILGGFEAEVAASEFEPRAFDEYTEFLRRAMAIRTAPTVADVRASREIGRLVLPIEPSASAGDERHQTVLLLSASSSASDRAERSRLIEEVRGLIGGVPGATLTGLTVVGQDLELAARRDLARFGTISVLLVVCWLFVLLRRPLDVLLAAAPVLFALVGVFAFMSVTGQKLNAVNIVVFPLLAGIAVDSGIFVVLAMRRAAGRGESWGVAMAPTVHAILCTAGTTMLGFGSLIWTHTPAVRSLGWAMMVGIVFALAACLLAIIPLRSARAETEARRSP